MLEHCSQFVPRTMDIRLYGTERQIHDLGDFFVRAVFHVTKQNAAAVFRPQLGDRPFDFAAQLSIGDLIERALSAGSELEGGGFDRIRRRRVR